MAIYHFETKVITRGVGRSVVAAAAYASCSQIYNDYDGVQQVMCLLWNKLYYDWAAIAALKFIMRYIRPPYR